MTKYKTEKKVKLRSELPADAKVGDVSKYYDGTLTIKDLNYTNKYGAFVLCDYTYDAEERERINEPWHIKKGKVPADSNSYEILHVLKIHNPNGPHSQVGYVIKNVITGELKALTYNQIWEIVYHEGAVNAVATVSHFGKTNSYLIDSINELPSFSSKYWDAFAFNEKGEALFNYSPEVFKKIETAIEMTIKEGLRKRKSQFKQRLEPGTFENIDAVAELILAANKISILTGAGISTMSGIPDYRSAVEGVWQKKPDLLQTLNQYTYLTDPGLFWESYYDLFALTLQTIIPYPTNQAVVKAIELIHPNEGHHFFKQLEEQGKDITIVTQNVDGLHQKAGSKQVFEIHGNIATCSCPHCHVSSQLTDIFQVGVVPTCNCGTVLRPDVVFFGDAVNGYEEAVEAVKDSDLIIVAGSNLQVSPFNYLPQIADQFEIPLVLLNGTETESDHLMDYVIKGDIGESCTLLAKKLNYPRLEK